MNKMIIINVVYFGLHITLSIKTTLDTKNPFLYKTNTYMLKKDIKKTLYSDIC